MPPSMILIQRPPLNAVSNLSDSFYVTTQPANYGSHKYSFPVAIDAGSYCWICWHLMVPERKNPVTLQIQ